ncbi:MAG: zf-HC2 domain-containing protein [Treponema sp.]|nr:zf-HC2 domain-containing protein [Treponema sp.]
MCPDPQLLSIYLDGELPSPWKEKLCDHFTHCSSCREKLENYQQLNKLIKKETYADQNATDAPSLSEEQESMEAAKKRVWNNLASKRQFTAASRSAVWHRRISIPVPAAAAAALVVLFSFAFAVRGTGTSIARQTESADRQNILFAETLVSDEEIPAIFPASADVNGMLQFLNPDGANIIILQLPENKNFSRSGEPAIIRAADYSSSRRQFQ